MDGKQQPGPLAHLGDVQVSAVLARGNRAQRLRRIRLLLRYRGPRLRPEDDRAAVGQRLLATRRFGKQRG